MNLKKDALLEHDLVLIHIENKPAFFARVEKITPDVKPKWWRVKFLVLTLPLKILTWIIDEEQIRGTDFTMGGTSVRIEKVVPPKEVEEPSEGVEQKRSGAEGEEAVPKKARVLSLHTNKKKN
jgi:hypothetical protein